MEVVLPFLCKRSPQRHTNADNGTDRKDIRAMWANVRCPQARRGISNHSSWSCYLHFCCIQSTKTCDALQVANVIKRSPQRHATHSNVELIFWNHAYDTNTFQELTERQTPVVGSVSKLPLVGFNYLLFAKSLFRLLSNPILKRCSTKGILSNLAFYWSCSPLSVRTQTTKTYECQQKRSPQRHTAHVSKRVMPISSKRNFK